MTKAITWKVSTFDELDIHSLYQILHLRNKVFVVEQQSPYLDPDHKDLRAIHLQGFVGGSLVAYSRLFRAGDYMETACIGRVVVCAANRKFGYGHLLMDKAIELVDQLFGEQHITISAQLYLKAFYESHGFKGISDTYLEDGIPHIRMERIG